MWGICASFSQSAEKKKHVNSMAVLKDLSIMPCIGYQGMLLCTEGVVPLTANKGLTTTTK